MNYKEIEELEKFNTNILDLFYTLFDKGADNEFLNFTFKNILNYNISTDRLGVEMDLNYKLNDDLYTGVDSTINSNNYQTNIFELLFEDTFRCEEDKFEPEIYNENLIKKLFEKININENMKNFEEIKIQLLAVLENYNKESMKFVKIASPEEQDITFEVCDIKLRQMLAESKPLSIFYLLKIYSKGEFIGYTVLNGKDFTYDLSNISDLEEVNDFFNSISTENIDISSVYDNIRLQKEHYYWR